MRMSGARRAHGVPAPASPARRTRSRTPSGSREARRAARRWPSRSGPPPRVGRRAGSDSPVSAASSRMARSGSSTVPSTGGSSPVRTSTRSPGTDGLDGRPPQPSPSPRQRWAWRGARSTSAVSSRRARRPAVSSSALPPASMRAITAPARYSPRASAPAMASRAMTSTPIRHRAPGCAPPTSSTGSAPARFPRPRPGPPSRSRRTGRGARRGAGRRGSARPGSSARLARACWGCVLIGTRPPTQDDPSGPAAARGGAHREGELDPPAAPPQGQSSSSPSTSSTAQAALDGRSGGDGLADPLTGHQPLEITHSPTASPSTSMIRSPALRPARRRAALHHLHHLDGALAPNGSGLPGRQRARAAGHPDVGAATRPSRMRSETIRLVVAFIGTASPNRRRRPRC